MLVLARKEEEDIRIGDDITVKVLSLRWRKGGVGEVRLGITAPAEVPVHRGEIYDKIERNEGAVTSPVLRWLHVWEAGEYRGSTRCTESDLARLMKPSDASYRGIVYQLTDSPDCPEA